MAKNSSNLNDYSTGTTVLVTSRPSILTYVKQLFKVYGKWLFGLMLITFMTGLFIYIYQSYQEHHHTKAFEALYLAQGSEDYQSVIEKFKGTVADELAYLKIAKVAYSKENFDEAKSVLKSFSDKFEGSFFQPYADLSLASIFEDEGNLDDALVLYQGILDDASFRYAWNSARYRICTILIERGRLEEAKQSYELFKENTIGSVWATKVAIIENALDEN